MKPAPAVLGLIAAALVGGCQGQPEAATSQEVASIVCYPGLPGCDAIGQSPDGLFQLSCDSNSPVREGVVTCTASNTDGSTPSITGWSFDSDSLTSSIVRPPATATSAVWSGPIVVNGAIAVKGVVSGVSELAPVAIAVVPRDWSSKIAQIPPANDVTLTTIALDGRPASQEWLGHGWEGAIVRKRGSFTVPAGGPNEGLIIYDEIPILAGSDVAYDSRALQAGSYFASLQPTSGHCNKARVVSIIPDIKIHEGFVPTGPNSHVGVFDASIDSIGRRMTESLLAYGGLSAASDVVAEVGRRAHILSDSFDYSPANVFSISDDGLKSCDFNYHP